MNKYITILAFLPFLTLTSAQTVVLVNGEAASVSLNGSEVTAVHNRLPRHMDGFIRPDSDIFIKLRPAFESEPEAAVVEENAHAVDKPLLIANAVFFKEDAATLSNKTIESLKRFAKLAQRNGPKTVILKSWYELGNTNSQQLVNNRLEACKEFLELEGVQGSLIFTSYTGAEEETDYVTVTFQ